MDIAMCLCKECPLSKQCYRHENSGSVPAMRQVVQDFEWSRRTGCGDFIDVKMLVSKTTMGSI